MSQRSLIWVACLILATGLTVAWGQLPLLDSAPLLRVALFGGLGLLALPLTLLFPNLDRRKSTIVLVVAAVILRISVLPAPVSDDVNRYLWEGRITLSGENPFQALADDPYWKDFQDEYWEDMNHRDRPTAYPPGIQWIMAGAVAVSYHPMSMKALALIGDLVTLLLLLKLLRLEGRPLRWAGFYAFNPVILMAFAAEAHFDSLMVAALLGALLAEKQKRPILMWLLFGVAIQIKLVCVVLGPLLLSRATIRHVWVLPLVLLLPSLPFLSAISSWWEGVTTFGSSGMFNGPLLTAISLTGAPTSAGRLVAMLIFGIIFLGTWRARSRGLSLVSSSFIVLGALLVCSPIVHFWYLAWILPLAALRPSFGWMTASITMAGYFLAWRTQDLHGWWGFEHTTAALLWLPAAIAFALQHRQLIPRLRQILSGSPTPRSGDSIGIVIPTLNPDEQLDVLIATLRKQSKAPIVIADATDAAIPRREPEEANVISMAAPLGRGNQIAAGISQLNSDWILIAHADALPSADWQERLSQAIHHHPDASMLVFGQRFQPTGRGTAIIEALNELRVIFGGVAFGDQTMVIRRTALDAAGGFPEQPLMEDVEVSLRLQAQGSIIYLGAEWQVCARKWHAGFARRFSLVIRLMITYQLARLKGSEHAKSYSEKLYRDYYTSPSSSG